jgi:hypothetical protein
VCSAEALRAAAAVGPYFVWEPWTPDAGWRPLAELTRPEVVAERVDAARTALITMFGVPADAIEERVMASITLLGLASRLVSPPLAALTLNGVLPVPEQLWWRPVPGGPWPIAYRGEATGADFVESVVERWVSPILGTVQERFAVSPQVLWGNVTSALAGAAGLLPGTAFDLVGACLERPPLAGTGTLVKPDPGHERRFLVRSNCCLYYRIPGGGTCGDCVLTPEADRRKAWAAALAR